MPRVVVTEAAVRGLERCREHLATRDALAARRAAEAIERGFLRLETVPDIGRPVSGQPALRELVIAFGSSGYVALYRYDPGDDVVTVLAFRHQREAGTDGMLDASLQLEPAAPAPPQAGRGVRRSKGLPPPSGSQ